MSARSFQRANGRAIGQADIITQASEINSKLAKTFRVCYEQTAITANEYVLLVDLSDTTNYPHSPLRLGAVDIDTFAATLTFATGSAEARVRVGVVTRLGVSDSDVSWLINARLGMNNASENVSFAQSYLPSYVPFRVFDGALVDAITSATETTNKITTTATLKSVMGPTVAAVGDVILKLEYVSDTFSASVDCLYHTER
jgi:hypothetical protein